jgi:hypothetical protein
MTRGGTKSPGRRLLVSVEETFAKVVGRHASDEGRQRPRTRSATRLVYATTTRSGPSSWRSNTMTRSSGDTRPSSRDTRNAAIEDARAAFAAAAEREAAQVQRILSKKVAETSVAIAPRLADRPVGLHRATMNSAAVVAFGALCTTAGYSLAAPVPAPPVPADLDGTR